MTGAEIDTEKNLVSLEKKLSGLDGSAFERRERQDESLRALKQALHRSNMAIQRTRVHIMQYCEDPKSYTPEHAASRFYLNQAMVDPYGRAWLERRLRTDQPMLSLTPYARKIFLEDLANFAQRDGIWSGATPAFIAE